MTKDDALSIIDRYLMSDRAPENSMGLSDLDGFLTGIVIGPKLVFPSQWLPKVWDHESPRFKTETEAKKVTSAIMQRYNEIVRGFLQSPPEFEPIFWETRDGIVIAADWAEGFNDAIKLSFDDWKPLLDDPNHAGLLRPIKVLCGSERHRDRKTENDMMANAAKNLSESIFEIHRYWQERNQSA